MLRLELQFSLRLLADSNVSAAFAKCQLVADVEAWRLILSFSDSQLLPIFSVRQKLLRLLVGTRTSCLPFRLDPLCHIFLCFLLKIRMLIIPIWLLESHSTKFI